MIHEKELGSLLCAVKAAVEAGEVALYLKTREGFVPLASCPGEAGPLASLPEGNGTCVVQVPGTEAYLVASPDGSGGLGRERILSLFAEHLGGFLALSRRMRDILVDGGKYRVVEEAVRVFAPVSTLEELQEAFASFCQDLGLAEALVLEVSTGTPRGVLAYGPLSVACLDRPVTVRGTPWEGTIQQAVPWVHRGDGEVSFVSGTREGRFPSMALIPLSRSEMFWGLASGARGDLGPEVLDVLVTVGDVLDSALSRVLDRAEENILLASVLLGKVRMDVRRGRAVLLFSCRVPDLADLDRTLGLAGTEKALGALARTLTNLMEGRAGVFRQEMVLGYRAHEQASFLEALARAIERNLPLSLPEGLEKVGLRMERRILAAFAEDEAEEAVVDLVWSGRRTPLLKIKGLGDRLWHRRTAENPL